MAISSILNLSVPIPPIAAPKPFAIDAESSPSSFNEASIMITRSGFLIEIIFSSPSPGRPTVAFGPSAFIKNNSLSSKVVFDQTVSNAADSLVVPNIICPTIIGPMPSPIG